MMNSLSMYVLFALSWWLGMISPDPPRYSRLRRRIATRFQSPIGLLLSMITVYLGSSALGIKITAITVQHRQEESLHAGIRKKM